MFLLLAPTEETHIPPRIADNELERLLAEIAQGQTDALEQLYSATKSAVYGFAYSFLRSPHNAEDVMQDTYVIIFNKAGAYRPGGRPMAWIMTIVRNLCRMKVRKKEYAELSLESEDKEPTDAGFEEHSLNKLVLNAALRILGEEERHILMLHSLSGLKHREIAKLLEIPTGTVLSKYHRALSKLKNHVKEKAQ